ncbi:hypothetical protein BHE74_00027494 [Ensete ventricosum]|uniref:Uncharacterized protein n=1 Tax=Ensete ventricosum TaxID=4639 RepID=A0A444FBY8_ENSVE|nr:hypothetical protein B296_00028351 [Ensete ventricosum]RWW20146.1 hypothetical protein GW17_00015753 [Ensete ventricosum]RWW65206.1 hypothetical protein BHE74_00027494 [Ensete ventricosum]
MAMASLQPEVFFQLQPYKLGACSGVFSCRVAPKGGFCKVEKQGTCMACTPLPPEKTVPVLHVLVFSTAHSHILVYPDHWM